MKIWVDLANSPQVLFFSPVILDLRRRGHNVVVTSRAYAQTIELADLHGLQHTVIGGHGGSKLRGIAYGLIERAGRLAHFARDQDFDLAVSHGSYAQALASAVRGIPFVTLMDYEHQPANHLCFRLAERVIVPECFPEWAIRRYGARSKTLRYHGLKEEVYLAEFLPNENYLESVGVRADRVIVVMRPPATWTLYHRFENPLFQSVLEYLGEDPNVEIVFLPRVASQRDLVRRVRAAKVVIPDAPLDGPNLLYGADVAIGGGGTMNREAAILGCATYSVFKGRLPAVDRYLVENGRMQYVERLEDLAGIPMEKRQERGLWRRSDLREEITHLILEGAN
jgi:predicted glycosyltransferase